MIIGICGIKRSASTVQFNIVRIAMELAGHTVETFGHNYRSQQTDKVHIFKRHPFKLELAKAADHIFVTDRSDGGIIGSLTRFNGKEPSRERIEDMRKHLNLWESYSDIDHYFHYHLWMKDRQAYTAKIIKTLGVNVKYKEVLKEFDKIKPPKEGQDPETLLFANHRTCV